MSARLARPGSLVSLRSLHLPASLRILLAVLIIIGPTSPAWAAYSTTGRWSETKYTKATAIHLALLPGDATWHSRILFWSLWDKSPGADTLGGALWRWNPPGGSNPCDPSVDNHNVSFINFTNEPPVDPFCAGHSALADGRLLVSGGHVAEDIGPEETTIFDPATATWSAPIMMQGGRWYASNVSMPKAGEALVFAGSKYFSVLSYGGKWDTDSLHRDTKLHQLNLDDSSVWDSTAIIAPQSGSPWQPRVREGHTLVGNDYISATILFGGRDSVLKAYSDMWFLRGEYKDYGIDYKWEKRTPENEGLARPRSGHTAAIDRSGRMLVFGGLDSTGGAVIGNLRRWTPGAPNGYGTWDNPPVTGSPPAARQGHAAIVDTMMGRDRMILFGGADVSGSPVDTKIWRLDMKAATPAWSDTTLSSGPTGRQGHTMVSDPVPIDHGTTGEARRVILYGGKDTNGYQNDLWELWIDKDTGDLIWNQVTAPRPNARAFHTALYDRIWKRMLVLGGQTGASSWSDSTWALTGLDKATLGGWTPLQKNPKHALGGHQSFEGPLIHNRIPERFTASGSTGSWSTLDSAYKQMPWYPFMFVLPSGNVFYAGPALDTRILDMTLLKPKWKTAGWTARNNGGSAVMYRPGEILKVGGEHGHSQSWTSERIQFNASDQAPSGWVLTDSMQYKRMEHNLTVLPNGEVLVTGGRDPNNNFVRRPELFNPSTLQWSADNTLELSPVGRGYHSSSILLPSGGVLTAGGNFSSGFDSSAIYCPPYLFKPGTDLAAARPQIACADTTLRWNWGRRFTLRVADTTGIRGACLIRSGAATHGFDQNQRYLPLTINGGDINPPRLFLTAPADSNIAPPGYYLLFLTGSPDRTDVPSVAKWVRHVTPPMADVCDSVKPAVMNDLTPDIVGPTSVFLTWTAPADDTLHAASGVANSYQLRRSSSAINSESTWNAATVVTGLPAPEPV